MEVEGVGFDAVELAIGTHLGLSLIEIGLGASLAIQLLYVVRACIEQVAVVRFLITRREASKDQDVFV